MGARRCFTQRQPKQSGNILCLTRWRNSSPVEQRRIEILPNPPTRNPVRRQFLLEQKSTQTQRPSVRETANSKNPESAKLRESSSDEITTSGFRRRAPTNVQRRRRIQWRARKIKGWVGGIAKYLLFLTGVDGWSFFFDTLLQHLWQQWGIFSTVPMHSSYAKKSLARSTI